MRYLLTILFMAALTGGHAQEAKRWKYGSFYSAGLLSGASGDALTVQTVQGAWKKRFFTGIGAGLDWYYTRTLPVFADVRFKVRERRSTSFLYVNLGASMPVGNPEPEFGESWYDYAHKGGLYFDGGAGFLLPIRKLKTSVLLTVGYSQKNLQETQTLKPEFQDSPWPNWWGARKYETDYVFRRWTFKLGFAL